ncbi:MAG: hypothetical protein JSR11_03895 [Bacteroidetes bacterium]|nr:hypothetical protein [Bacteroidota bacterium]
MNFIITNIPEPSLKDEKLLERHSSLKTEKHKFHFKMYDDDRNLYYEGLSKTNFSFDPLDEFGYSAGCTEIYYLEKGKFKRL